jgi:hypothetical protein
MQCDKIQKCIITLEAEIRKRSTFMGKVVFWLRLNKSVRYEISAVAGYLNLNEALSAEKIREISFNILSKFGEKEFNRNYLSEKVIKILKDGLDLEKNPNSLIVKEVTLANKLGIAPIKNKGAYGSLIYRNYRGESIAIYKIAEGSPFPKIFKIVDFFLKKIKNTCQKLYLPFLEERNLGCALAEVSAYYISQQLGFSLIPDTYIVEFEKKKGALQEFVKGYQEAREYLFSNTPNEESIVRFQQMCVLDYLIGNLDRHNQNWLVKGEDGQIESIQLIDNGNAFAIQHIPDELGENPIRNQYAWRNYPISKENLRESVKQLIADLNFDDLDEILNHMKKDYSELQTKIDGFFEKSKKCMIDRIKVLKIFVQEGGKNFNDLAKLTNESEINHYVERYGR